LYSTFNQYTKPSGIFLFLFLMFFENLQLNKILKPISHE